MKNMGLKVALAIMLILALAGGGLYASIDYVLKQEESMVATLAARSPYFAKDHGNFLCENAHADRSAAIRDCERDPATCAAKLTVQLHRDGSLPSTTSLRQVRRTMTGDDDRSSWLVSAGAAAGADSFIYHPCTRGLDLIS